MIKTRNNPNISNLSLIIPRRIHRMAKRKFHRSGAKNFTAYISMLIMNAPEEGFTAKDIVSSFLIDFELNCFRKKLKESAES